MALKSNSAIRDWLTWDGVPPTTIPSCTLHACSSTEMCDIAPTNCAQVCNDTTSVFMHPSTNLVTCGIWSALIIRNTFLGPQNAIIEINGSFFLDDEKGDLLEPFNQVGLNRDGVETLRYADIISSCFLSIYTAVHWNIFAGSVQGPQWLN